MCDVTDNFYQTALNFRKNFDPKKVPITKRGTKYIKTATILKDLITKIKDVVSAISQMKHFLLKNRYGYLNLYSVLDSSDHLSDADRDAIDNTVETFIKNYTNIISQLKLESCSNVNLTEQMKQHCQHVICLVENYLKHIISIYTEQRQVRVKRALDKCKVSKLETFCRNENGIGPEAQMNLIKRKKSRKNSSNDLENEKLSDEQQNNSQIIHTDLHLAEKYSDEENLLSTLTLEEQQIFKQENDQLFDELNALTDEVKKIEGQVVEIAQLQELFTEKVLQQETELNRVSLTMIGSTENIKDGNDQLRDAMKKNAGFRVYILFFIIIMSFVVLFLDWYQ